MKLIIDIPDEVYKDEKMCLYFGCYSRQLHSTLYNGIPLDKIRAEIEQTTSRYTISRERGAMGQVEWSDRLIKESEVLEILDKYKAESEGKE